MNFRKSVLVWFLLFYNMSYPATLSARSQSFEDFCTVTKIAAIGGAIAGGCYTAYYYLSFYHAQSTLTHNKNKSSYLCQDIESIYNDLYAQEEKIITRYLYDTDRAVQLCNEVHLLVSGMKDILRTTHADIQAWQTYKVAHLFLLEAHSFHKALNAKIQQAEALEKFLGSYIPLLKLENLLISENACTFQSILYASDNNMLNCGTVCQYASPQTPWPLTTTWKVLEQRKMSYKIELENAHASTFYVTNASTWSARVKHDALLTIQRYEKAQSTITSFYEYSAEMQAALDFKLKEEKLQQQKIAAQAALMNAQVEENRIRHEKEQELATLRDKLSAVKQAIAAGDNGYYIHQQKRQLQNRIHELKRELYGSSSFFEALVDVIADKD